MAERTFKANIFDVEIDNDGRRGRLPFERAIERACSGAPEDRVRNVNLKDRRLEHWERDRGCYLLNFTTFDYPGPGRVREATPAAPIGLADDEFFSHQTAMLYDPDEQLAFIESGRAGMGPGAIAKYLGRFRNPQANYLMMPRLDPEASARARRYRQFRRVEMRVALSPAGAMDRDSDVGVIEAFGERYGAKSIDVVMGVGRERRRSLGIDSILGLLRDALRAHGDDRVEVLKVYGRENEDDDLEFIDLIQQRERRERVLTVDRDTRQVNHVNRWRALTDIRQEFLRDVADI